MRKIISSKNSQRNSNIELFRILTMLCIVAHHYVVNSGLLPAIKESGAFNTDSLFLLILGWGGKTGINCFVLITGYFMCKSHITFYKLLKLILQVEFYNIILYIIFVMTGYQTVSSIADLKPLLPITSVANSFICCFILFYLFIPFLNILINNLDQKKHALLILLSLFTFTILHHFHIKVTFNYVEWFAVIYIIAAYIRLYPNKYFDSLKFTTATFITTLLLSWFTVLIGAWRFDSYGKASWYNFVSDSNTIMAVTTSVAAFLFFKNIKIGYNKIINVIASATFGVLLIHANSNNMRQWLWKDTLDNVGQFHAGNAIVHAIISITSVYVICTLIDLVRIYLIERPFFKRFFVKT